MCEMTPLSTWGITWSVKLSARRYGDHFGFLRDRCMGASYAGWLREALHGCLPRAEKDHTLRAPLLVWLAWRHLFPASVRDGLRGYPGWDPTWPDGSAPCLSARLSRSLIAFMWLQARSEQSHTWLQAYWGGASRITVLTKHDHLDKTGSSF